MKNALEINMSGLKCDNPTCDYVEKWVNVKCPKCGEILLTEADYNNTKFLLGIIDLGNKIFPKRRDDEKYVTMTVEMDGSGDMNFNIKE